MLTRRASTVFRAVLFLLAPVLLVVACGGGPGETRVKDDLQTILAQAFPEDAVRVESFRRLGSSPLASTERGDRQIVYYNAILELNRDIDLSSWQGLNLGAVASLLGATERGITGLKQGGNQKGDLLHVHGSVTYVDDNGDWQPVRTVHAPPSAPPPEDNTGPPADALRIVENIRGLFHQAGTEAERREIITDELEKTYFRIRLRIDRSEGTFLVLGGSAAGEYYQVASLIASALQQAKMPSRAVITDGSVENLKLMEAGGAGVALVQNNLSVRATEGRPPFTAAIPDLRALASLFPEQVHVILRPGAEVSSLADLRGKRVDLGEPESGTRVDAEALLAAAGLSLPDLAEASERGLADGIEALKRNELDAVIATISAPARSIQTYAEGNGLTLLSLSEADQARLTDADASYVAVTMPPGTYAGQQEPVRTVAAVALLVARASLPDAEVEAVLRQVFDGIDYFAAGSAAGSQISRASARIGVGIPWHPAAERFFGGS